MTIINPGRNTSFLLDSGRWVIEDEIRSATRCAQRFRQWTYVSYVGRGWGMGCQPARQ